mmetsp:Transcript_12986/g.36513  ORF Transcript_12986/g.36513 Transcript_12986/m.36513 type:complete len:146 (-) Transcript_12986:613-1050(-)|eukprot:CAMPEP_0117659992 /NCGR_PEP_ID=MMETSP0804-20121206/6727_1 /TAXON_ID=1074897 /ORGANISM="Tetraselmis astigmatica, Strain CCMP880" /LENGTH=145 /DNA_ID=CAMNT_0005466685 /DNA_START=347 /DNA_END=784 /DNA_ORIENTATION=+
MRNRKVGSHLPRHYVVSRVLGEASGRATPAGTGSRPAGQKAPKTAAARGSKRKDMKHLSPITDVLPSSLAPQVPGASKAEQAVDSAAKSEVDCPDRKNGAAKAKQTLPSKRTPLPATSGPNKRPSRRARALQTIPVNSNTHERTS